MVLKTKLILGLAFLFLIIFSLVGVCSYYVGRMGGESKAILKDNYASIVYARDMLAGLDDIKTAVTSTMYDTGRQWGMSDYYGRLFESGRKVFETNLKSENNNITEIHEREHVDRLNSEYDSYVKLCLQIKNGQRGNSRDFDSFLPATERLKQIVNAIYDVNMQAVVRKSQLASRDASRFVTSMAIMGSICILLALGYFWYFPVYVSTTISYLAERMRRLLKSGGIVVDLETKDEAFVILQGIGLLESKLSEWITEGSK
jgi:hypothetical protein